MVDHKALEVVAGGGDEPSCLAEAAEEEACHSKLEDPLGSFGGDHQENLVACVIEGEAEASLVVDNCPEGDLNAIVMVAVVEGRHSSMVEAAAEEASAPGVLHLSIAMLVQPKVGAEVLPCKDISQGVCLYSEANTFATLRAKHLPRDA